MIQIIPLLVWNHQKTITRNITLRMIIIIIVSLNFIDQRIITIIMGIILRWGDHQNSWDWIIYNKRMKSNWIMRIIMIQDSVIVIIVLSTIITKIIIMTTIIIIITKLLNTSHYHHHHISPVQKIITIITTKIYIIIKDK